MHLGLAPSYSPPIRLPDVTRGSNASNVHVRGLVELARLFAAFDAVAMSRCSSLDQSDLSPALLAQTEDALSLLSLTQGDGTQGSTRMADYCITKEWMRTIIWQEALSRHMLSSTSYIELMTFRFPAAVSRDLLYSLQGFTQSELLPLGRDQVCHIPTAEDESNACEALEMFRSGKFSRRYSAIYHTQSNGRNLRITATGFSPCTLPTTNPIPRPRSIAQMHTSFQNRRGIGQGSSPSPKSHTYRRPTTRATMSG